MYDNLDEVPRRTMILFFMVDTSGSMAGERIGAVNEAIANVLPEIRSISGDNADAQIKIAALTFSSGAQWVYDAPIEADKFVWNDVSASGVTDFGAACLMLNEKLSRSAFMAEARGSYAPAIFLLSDGDPTDDYKRGLQKLQSNNWFKSAIKVAVAVGQDTNVDVLKEFTGNSESVLMARNPEALKAMIRFVAVTSSQIGSKSSSVQTEGTPVTKQAEMAEQVTTFSDTVDNDVVSGW
jgi:uncharacterized protein YegL